MSSFVNLPPILGVLGLVCAFVIYLLMMRYSDGNEKIRAIAKKIHEGAMVFMNTEYMLLAGFAAVMLVLILISDLGPMTAVAFAVGALCSAAAGYLGMFAATRANVRTTTAAQDSATGPVAPL